jgi:endonuclease G, mitochondrial
MPRKRPSRASPYLVIFAAVLIVAAYLAYVQWQNRQAQASPLEQSAGLVSDDRILYGGAPRPAPGAGEEVQFIPLKNQAYIVGYSESRKDPLWSAYRVHAVANPPDLPRPSDFRIDDRTAAKVRTLDYTRSGYQRGHMAPNKAIADDYGKDAQFETFLLSNVCPQTPELNEHVWERLEVDERKYADKFEEVWVIDGPIFADLNGGRTDRLASGIAVPSAYFKILIDEQDRPGGRPRIFSVIMPQNVKGTELPQEFLTSVSEIEKETHLDFFWKLDAATQAELESKVWKMW